MPGGELQKNFKKVKTEEDVAAVFSKFFGSERWELFDLFYSMSEKTGQINLHPCLNILQNLIEFDYLDLYFFK